MSELLRFTRQNITPLIRIFLIPIVIFVAANSLVVLEFFKISDIINKIDKPIHVISGAALVHSLIILVKSLEANKLIRKQKAIINLYIVVSTLLSVVVLWEFHEFALDTIFETTLQEDLDDTMIDMLLGTAGGIFVLLFYNMINMKVHLENIESHTKS